MRPGRPGRHTHDGRRHGTTDPEAATHAHIGQTNAGPKPFIWTESADTVLARGEARQPSQA